jgi:ferredoxin-fold anticodon binding domain-containing protein
LHGGRKFAHLKMILVDFLANVGIFCLREEGIKHDAKKISVLIQISIDLLFISATLDLDKKIALDVLNERI